MSNTGALFFGKRIESVKQMLEAMTVHEIEDLCTKYGCTKYAKSKEKLIQKLVAYLIVTNNITDNTLFDLTKEPEFPLSKSEVIPKFSSPEVDIICRVRLDEDFDMRMVFPKEKTRADLEKVLATFFNEKSR